MGKKKAFHDILPYLRSNWCPRAFALRPDRSMASKWVDIYDDTGRLYRMPKQLLTGDELYSAWKRIITRTLCVVDGTIKKLVLVCDDQDRVPKRKRKEWAKRADSRTKSTLAALKNNGDKNRLPPPVHAKYTPADCYFTANGIEFAGSKAAELIDLRTLRASGDMRKDMYKYLMWRIQFDAVLHQEMDPEATLVLDFLSDGPCLFRPGRGWVKLPHLRHPHGEADKAMVMWAVIYRHMGCTINSNDRDMIPILFHYALVQGYSRNGSPLWWVFEARDAKIKAGEAGCLDVMHMTTKLAERFNTQLFLLAACLCGTDYVDKKQCTPNAGQDVIFSSVLRNKEIASAIKPLASLELLARLEQMGHLDRMAKLQKHNQTVIQCWGLLLDNIKACGKAPGSKPLRLADKLQALDDLLFNVDYWAQNWAGYRDVQELPT